MISAVVGGVAVVGAVIAAVRWITEPRLERIVEVVVERVVGERFDTLDQAHEDQARTTVELLVEQGRQETRLSGVEDRVQHVERRIDRLD